VYVHQSGDFSFDRWFAGLDAGRSFVTTGPMLLVEVDGNKSDVLLKADADQRRVHVKGAAHSAGPLDRIEIVVNGAIAKTLQPANHKTSAGGYETLIDAEVTMPSSGWMAVRCWEPRPGNRLRYAHTAPWHVAIDGMLLRPRRVETDFLIHRVTSQIERSKSVLPPAAMAEYERALAVYRDIAKRARD
jgi:hypothetical protein